MQSYRYMDSLKGRLAALSLAAMAICGFASPGSAQAAYPDKPIRLVVGFAPGGANDTIGRLIAKQLTDELGSAVLVENKPGAGSNIGTAYVAHSPPDGYTLFLTSLNNAINQSLYKHLSFNIVTDFSPVALIATMPNIVVVRSSTPYHSVKDLVAYAKANPGRLTFGSSGVGTTLHLAGELFKAQAGVDIMHVPYKGSALAMNDLLGGRVDIMFDNLLSSLPHVKAGKLRALAVTGPRRSALLPDVPTMVESGYPKFNVASWFGVLAPAHTPAPIVGKINAAVNAALKKPELAKQLEHLGASPQPMTPQEFGQFVKSEVAAWGQVVHSTGISAD